MSIKRIFLTIIICILTTILISYGSDIKNTNTKNIKSIYENSNSKNEVNDDNADNTVINNESSESFIYKDGEYTGVGNGFRGETKVSVKVESGKKSNIQILESQDDDKYLDRASELINQIIESQSTTVDTVSGATYSSNAIIQAVDNALESAK